MLLVSALYYSTASAGRDDMPLRQRMDAIMKSSARNNHRLGLTGALVYERGRFIQILEGPRGTVSAMLSQIAGDPRHTDMVIAEVTEISARRYADWSMGFINADTAPAELGRLPDLDVAPAETLRARIDLVLNSCVRVHVAA